MDLQQQTPSRPNEQRLEELEALLEQTAALAETAVSPEVFSPRLLEAAMSAASGRGATLWRADAEEQWLTETAVGACDGGQETRSSFANAAVVKRRVLFVPPGGRVESGGPVSDSAHWSIFAPASASHVLELCLGRDVGADRRLLSEVARSFAELVGNFFERRELSSLRQGSVRWQRLEAFVKAIHTPLELTPTAYAIANEGRLVVGCDRLSVAVGRSVRIAAVSGVERPDQRADAVVRMRRLAAAALASEGSHWQLSGELAKTLPKRLEQAWRDYRATVPDSNVELIVLKNRALRPHAVLIAEWFDPATELVSPGRLEQIATHAELALSNAAEATPSVLGRFLRSVGAPFRLSHLPATLAIGTLAAAVLAVLLFWQIDFTVTARGRLRPAVQREIFAPRDGVVRTLNVEHGEVVRAGDELLVLTDPGLDFETERVLGDLRTAQQRLVSIRATRTTRANGGRPNEPARMAELAGEEKELLERIAGLERQLAILEQERESLKVVSPIEGVVLTWETGERLASRPIRRGQQLLTVARPDDDWLLELYVPDKRVGHLLEAQQTLGEGLPIDYLLASDPTVTHRETVESVAYSTELHERDEPSVRVTARLPRSAIHDPRPGSTVVGNIHCGKRPAGYVWFHELIEAFQTHVLF